METAYYRVSPIGNRNLPIKITLLHTDSSFPSSQYHQISKDQISESLKTTSFLKPLTVTVPNPLQVLEITVKA
ncbi:hypothetical protein QYF36_022313 [Acer negundo]|nr:hypothetical protein QYF36_022313 [Acer negundo]